jgi:hypothetical protein
MRESWQGNPFCLECFKNCAKECKSCHRPFPKNSIEKYFSNPTNVRCNSCETKVKKAKRKKEEIHLASESDETNTESEEEEEEINLETEIKNSKISPSVQQKRKKQLPTLPIKNIKEAIEEGVSKSKESKKKIPQKKRKGDAIKGMIEKDIHFQINLNYPH